ncbi:MAG: hypothetical protein KatS3mg061_1823 [Dehalococcoidia bacterium]|nr:MAG: hypothetical protein KatS3mg061_1823 [Dehalococcoidia bacterium]
MGSESVQRLEPEFTEEAVYPALAAHIDRYEPRSPNGILTENAHDAPGVAPAA